MSLRIRVSDPAGVSRLVEVFPDPGAVAQRVADLVQEVVGACPEANLVLPAGSTPIPAYRELVHRSVGGSVDLSRVHVYQLDEVEGSQPVNIHAPLIDMKKTEIIRLGLSLGVDYSLTCSCYDPMADGRPCGRCDPCRLRGAAFEELGIADPVL